MDQRQLTAPLFVVLLVAFSVGAVAAPASAPIPESYWANAAILFTHAQFDASGNLQSTALLRANLANGLVTQLTPQIAGTHYRDGRWSPSGQRIVYERASEATRDRSQLYTMDQDGGRMRRITPVLGLHQQAVWGPGASIAFVDGTTNCLSVVQADGQRLRTLLCPMFDQMRFPPKWSTPHWSKNGKSVFLEVSQYYKQGLSLYLRSRVYRVNVATGHVTLLANLGESTLDYFSQERMISMQFSPNGTRGLYSQSGGGGGRIFLADFATGEQKYIDLRGAGDGASYTAKWSHDGRQIAFTHITVELNYCKGKLDYIAYIGLYVMDADGSHVRLITKEPFLPASQDRVVFMTVADWSSDDSRILLNRSDSSRVENGEEYVGHPLLEVVTLATHTTKILKSAKGKAGDGAWFQP
ncbi:hypothetical protein ACFPME_01885 [Rhodanobacter umsongensis]|uniref:Uncharacterized protein n=1 Tax=Rhodanobacter umsongensis TaxID=633153 RepID=A0ABW0JGT8_9GAMM